MISWLFLLAGLAALYFGAQMLIAGGVRLALRLGLTPLVIGLTIIAYGTSSPEMVVSLRASLSGNGAIAIGNIVGSNICNIALILGLCALVKPIEASRQIIRREIPVMIGVSVLAMVFLMDGWLARWEGAVLFAALIVYTVSTVRSAGKQPEPDADFADALPVGPESPGAKSLPAAIGLTLGGLAVLVLGSEAFVRGAVALASGWGVSQVVIGLTVVAVGTSMPELATSLVAAIKGQSDVALGNVVGSNIFNVIGILGLSAMVAPISAPEISWIDLGLMLLLAVGLLPLARSGGRISRLEGAVLLAIYAGYTGWLVSAQSGGV
ncbi:MAG: calcium/sodium antiporter [Verrucomicrobiota bacterium]